MGIQFHETQFGHQFFGSQLPKLIKAIDRTADKYIYKCEMVNSPKRALRKAEDKRVITLTTEIDKVLGCFYSWLDDIRFSVSESGVDEFISAVSEHISYSIRFSETDSIGNPLDGFYFDFVLTVKKIK